LFIIISVSGPAIATIRLGNLVAYNGTNDRTDNRTFGLVATPSNHIAKHTACARANGGTNDTATSITATSIILRSGHRRGKNSKCNTCEKHPTFHKIFFSRNCFVKV
jgi:hypothetical protein